MPLARENVEARLIDTWQMLVGVAEAAAMAPPVTAAGITALPLTLIAGFLGAGKTTLLHRLLTGAHGRRLTVLVNDFGAVNIDAALVASRSDDMITLTNGCACCTMAGGLARALADLAARPTLPQHIVCEASGIADPGSLAQIALANPAIAVYGIVSVVDADMLSRLRHDDPLADLIGRQIAAADLVLLNKTDLLAPDCLTAMQTRVAALRRRDSRVIPTRFCAVAPETVLREAPVAMPPAGAASAMEFETATFESATGMDRDRLTTALDSLPATLLRAKGFVYLTDNPACRYLLQRVGTRWTLEAQGPWQGDAPGSRIVLIARQDDGAALTASLDRLETVFSRP